MSEQGLREWVVSPHPPRVVLHKLQRCVDGRKGSRMRPATSGSMRATGTGGQLGWLGSRVVFTPGPASPVAGASAWRAVFVHPPRSGWPCCCCLRAARRHDTRDSGHPRVAAVQGGLRAGTR